MDAQSGSGRSSKRGSWSNRQARHHNPALALLAAGAAGYALSWLIHSRRAETSAPMRSRAVGGPWPAAEGRRQADATDWNQPRPSGDSPKRHGDVLPNVVRMETDSGERF